MARTIGIGLIGTGFMGKCHALAYRHVAQVFDLALQPKLVHIADPDPIVAQKAASQFGFLRHSDQWEQVIDDPEVTLVSITAPNYLHEEMAIRAIAAGKHILCEKPLAMSAEGAYLLHQMAEAAQIKTMVGYNYLKSPAVQMARQLLGKKELGEIYEITGHYAEDYMASPAVPFSWRCKRAQAGSGVLGDLGCHLISLLQAMVGPIKRVSAQMQTVIPIRQTHEVENEDQLQALLQFENGAAGTFSISRVAWGRKMGLNVSVTGEQGALVFNQENMNELHLYRLPTDPKEAGFQKIFMGPQHPDYGDFCPAPGHGLGYNDLKVIEIKDLLKAIETNKPAYPSFKEGYETELVSNAMEISAKLGQTVDVATLRREHRLINFSNKGLGTKSRLMKG